MKANLKDFSIDIGDLKRGKNNQITDVKGVKVGHITYDEGKKKTGITAILPHDGNMFREKLISATHIINGFGKSIGLMQIDELGTLETPILLTNTLSAGRVSNGLVEYMLKDNKDIGRETGTVNPVVCECNDGHLNDIQDLFLSNEDVVEAIKKADTSFQEGNVGAGTGMVCYGLKGGIGSSSRLVTLDNEEYTIGALVLSNFGRTEDLLVNGKNIGKKIKEKTDSLYKKEDAGSIIVIIGTDIPLSHRQLKRVIKKAYPGISKTGSFTSNGSGEVVLGFSTATKIKHYEERDIFSIPVLADEKLNEVFKGTKEATEEAILSSLFSSETVVGRDENKIYSIKEFKDLL